MLIRSLISNGPRIEHNTGTGCVAGCLIQFVFVMEYLIMLSKYLLTWHLLPVLSVFALERDVKLNLIKLISEQKVHQHSSV